MTDIIDQLQAAMHAESAALAPMTSEAIEAMRKAQVEIERLREAIMYVHDTLYETRTMPANRVGYEIEWCIDHARTAFKGDSND